MTPLLDITGLSVEFLTRRVAFHAVKDVSLSITSGKVVCMVGESGCGKSVTALSILRLIQSPPGRISAGSIRFEGTDLVGLPMDEMAAIRGRQISMIFQDPMSSLNPVFTCGHQIAEMLYAHGILPWKQAREKAIDLLHQVRIPDPHRRAHAYPHQLSGGMRQRVMIAMALACGPKLLIADEPTTALDVTVQAQILDLLYELKNSLHMSILFITHDLGVVADIADEVVILYAGSIAERGEVKRIFEHPRHPYTIGLMKSVPRICGSLEPLYVIQGTLPDITNRSAGCKFYDRCSRCSEQCRQQPRETQIGPNHYVSCFNA